MAGHHWRRQASTASDRWRRVGPLAVGRGPAEPRVRPNPRWAPYWQPGPTALLTVKNFLNFGAGQTLLRNDVQIYFSKDFNARKYFWIFVKNRKSARKVSSMHECFQNSNMQWKNRKKSRKAKWWRVNMRYVPIYLRQGLVVSSLTSRTFLLLWLPLIGSF